VSLHNSTPDAGKLDRLARRVLVAAVKFERAKHEASRYGETSSMADELCQAVSEYREAMVAELIGGVVTQDAASVVEEAHA
jgi:hypothetical protein